MSSLLNYINSDLYTIGNISKKVVLNVPPTEIISEELKSKGWDWTPPNKWETIIQYLPLEYFSLIESYNDRPTDSRLKMYDIEEFDSVKYACNPKKYAYDKYGITNMWRPIMILNKCTSIVDFDFKYIKYYDINNFSRLMSILISRMQHSDAL